VDLNEQERIFGEWTLEHGGILYRAVNGFAAGEDRNDLLQEILLAVWISIPAFRAQAKPSTYLYRVCHNAALLWVRGQRNYRRRLEEHFKAREAFASETQVEADERLAQLYSAIQDLKPVDRSLILMSLDDLSYREISEVLGISESNVGVRLNRIKERLTQKLKGKQYDLR
jgi:RNA polymerase sigma-70 factor (ECF subfamily)